MNMQVITTPGGERMILIPEQDYHALIEAVEEASDLASARRFEARLAAGDEELVPSAVVDRLLAGENPVRVWRLHRGLTLAETARLADLSQAYVSQIETGKRRGTLDALKPIADALGVQIDDLV